MCKSHWLLLTRVLKRIHQAQALDMVVVASPAFLLSLSSVTIDRDRTETMCVASPKHGVLESSLTSVGSAHPGSLRVEVCQPQLECP